MRKTNYMGVDIGGSHISCAVIDSVTGEIKGKIYHNEVNCKGSCGEIVSAWEAPLQECLREEEGIAGIGVAVPGPFDYRRGISMIEGVEKYEALFGLDLKELVRTTVFPQSLPVHFVNDASGFALGEYYAGAAKGSKRTLVVTLGTGFGTTFLREGEIQTTAGGGVPADGYLYNIPFGESIADDYFSTRWFVKRWQEISGTKVRGVKEIAVLAQDGNTGALELFDEFARNLSGFIAPWLKEFCPDCFVIGGSIAKASSLFLDKLVNLLKDNGITGIAVTPCTLWETAPLVGAAMYTYTQEERNNDYVRTKLRETEQFEAAVQKTSPEKGMYDIYPAFPVGSGKIGEGYEELARRIAGKKQVVIDGYIGVRWDRLKEQLNHSLASMGKKVRWFHTDVAMHPAAKIEEIVKPYLGEPDSIFGKVTDRELMDWFDKEKLDCILPDKNADITILIGCGAALAGWEGELIYVDLPKNELQFRMRAGQVTNLGAAVPEDGRSMYKRFYFVDWIVLNRHKANLLPAIDLIIDEQRKDRCLFMEGGNLRAGLSAMAQNFFRVRPWFEPGAWGGTWMKERMEGLNKEVRNLAWSFELMVLENGLLLESDSRMLEVSFDFLMYNSYREVLGDCAEIYKYDFPIRFDFLDTFDGGNLSVQCHPRPAYIREQFGMPFTQDETYYILDCKNKPHVYLGFQEGIDPEEFHRTLQWSQQEAKEIDIERFVQKLPAQKHDLFLIPNGTIHASGSDNLVLEISSAPYIFTFKMYDWMRLDLDGRPRPINIEHGMKNLYFERSGERVKEELISHPYVLKADEHSTLEHLPTHPEHFYDVYRYSFNKYIEVETSGKCHVWMLVEGSSVIVETAAGMKQRFNYAETFVIPAAAGSYTIMNEGTGRAMMVKAFMK